jgi:hypothetical protein
MDKVEYLDDERKNMGGQYKIFEKSIGVRVIFSNYKQQLFSGPN